MEKKTLHIVSHSHWDREWYMSFEQHRMRLVELFDALIETMEQHPEYKYYHMDGQYVVIEDYLEIRPHMRDRLLKLIRDDRIQIGPWYVLQDEYLTSGEANVRNMLYGIKLCRELGAEPVACGYFPDAFGNVAQAPQILKGFDVDYAAFGRGIGAILENNTVSKSSNTNPSELIWRSPDGSEVIGVMFVAWYHNSMELPTTPEALKPRIDKILKDLEPSANTPHLLGLNGCDHQPVQRNVYEAIRLANDLYGDRVQVIHSNFKDYLKAITPYRDKFPVLEGEINGQRTEGAVPLIDTASTHVPIKQLNHKGQNALEKIAEPLSVIAMLSGDEYRQDQLFYAWKKLMQNHPHDSICTCSCDDVARDMTNRFSHSLQVAQYVSSEAMTHTADGLDTLTLADHNIVVFHTSPFKTTDTVCCYVDFPENSGVDSLSIVDEQGTPVPCGVKHLGRTFTYTLPKDRFRQSRYVDRFEVRLLVTMEGVGYRTFRVVEKAAQPVKTDLQVLPNGAQNEFLRFEIAPNGSLKVTDLRDGGAVMEDLNVLEDCGDAGESYNFRPALDDAPITTRDGQAEVWLEEQTDYAVTYGIRTVLQIPAGICEKRRTGDLLPHVFTTRVTLTAGVPRVDVTCSFHNQAENHRVRALFMPRIHTDYALAEGQFDVIKREIQPYHTWKNPCYCQRMQAFFGLEDAADGHGLLIATRGLNEYEILRDGQNTMALTLLRCIAEIGDWGYFPTPDAQCKGDHTMAYSIIPFTAATKAQAYHQAFTFNGDSLHAVQTGRHGGAQPACKTVIKATGDYMSFAALKKAEADNDAVLRFYNAGEEPTTLTLAFPAGKQAVAAVNLAEQHPKPLSGEPVNITVPAKKIVSYKIKF